MEGPQVYLNGRQLPSFALVGPNTFIEHLLYSASARSVVSVSESQQLVSIENAG